MKKLFVSVGLAATGAAGLQPVFGQSMEAAPSPKIWNVAANLRGFYDDNYAVAHNKTGSFGFEVSPSISVNKSFQQTDIGIRYTFGMYYYVQRADNGIDPLDYTHQGDFWLDHAFSERVKLNITDTIVMAQDPELLQGGTTVRANGNNIVNHAKATLTSQWTRQFSTATHYSINTVNYENGGTTNTPANVNPDNAALLNRVEQNIGTDFQWQYTEETMAFIGYAYSWVQYIGNSEISQQATILPGSGKIVNYWSNARNSRTHYGYVGLSQVFTPSLSGTFRVGASYTDIYNDPVSDYNSTAPYADINLTYTYAAGSYVQVGFTQDQNATDVVAPGSNYQLTQYQETSVLYTHLTHQFDPKLSASLTGQYQHSIYKDGAYNGTGDNSIDTGVNFNYQINRHFSANTGYNFSELFSSVNGRANSRNVVYLGLGANY
jgi:hypothetical protein